MNLLDQKNALRARLSGVRFSDAQIIVASGGELSASWLSKFRCGAIDNPRIGSLDTLDRALDALDELSTERAAA